MGQVLRQIWPHEFGASHPLIWQGRGDCPADWFHWDMLARPYPGPPLTQGVILHLAGITPGPGRDLADNTPLAIAACTAAMQAGARHVFITSSAAVYGPGTGADLTEGAPLNPVNPYGHAKAAMETAVLQWKAGQTGAAPAVTILRIGNVLGLDALIGAADPAVPVILDPVPDAPGGPVRSYIGPRSLAAVLAHLCQAAMAGTPLPAVINIAAAPAVAMAALLVAADQPWRYGPSNPAVVARVVLATARLQALAPLPANAGQPATMIAEWRSLHKGPA